MPIDKLIPQYLNLDDDERILKSYEMVDALNVRISHEEDGDAGVIKNVEGNRIIPPKNAVEDALPTSGRNRCVGVCTSEAHKCVYFFIYNSEDNHGIYRYIAAPGSEDSNVFEKVYENSVLNFNDTAYINADLIVNQDAEHLLYFTDDRNEPRKINATRALAGGYNTYINTGTIAQKEDFLAVCKKPPMTAPIIEFIDNPKRKVNRIRNSLFQFAYQYVYDDGEYSALSPASVLAVSPRHLSAQGDSPFTDTKYNEIKVTLQNSKGPVKKLILYVRNGNTGYYSRVKELDNSDVISSQDFVFANDGIYVQASDADTQKTFDAVPQRAGAQVFSNNRLFYGNYVEGFDNLTPNVQMNPVLHPAGANLSTVDVRLPQGGQLDGPRLLPSALDKFRLALGPDNEDWENIELFGSPGTQTIVQELIDDLVGVGAIQYVTGLGYNLIVAVQFAVWRAGLDAIVPDTKKSFGGGNLTATSGVLHDTAGGTIISQDEFANPDEQTGNYAMRFEIDLANIPSQGFSGETTAAVRLDVSGSSIGTANNNTGGQYYTTDIECLGEDGGVLSHTPTSVRYLQPKNTSFDYDNDYQFYKQVQHCGNFSGLSIQSGLQFSTEVDLSNTTALQAGNAIAAALKGKDSRMYVTSAKYSDYGPRDRWRGTNALKGEGPDGNFHFAECPANAYRAHNIPGVTAGKEKDQSIIYLSWSGFYTFIVRHAEYNQAAGKITGVITPVALTLEADEGLVGKFNTGTNPKKYNHFLKEPDNVDDRKAHSDTYTDAFVRCGVNIDEYVLNRAGIVTAINEFSVDGDVEIVNSASIEDMFTLKSGANHEFGIVYFDDRGRHGGVQRLGAVEIPHLYDAVRSSDIGEKLYGKAEVDIRLKHQPPVWATKWAPVYAGNSTYDFYLYTGVAEAFVPIKNLKRDIRSTSEDTEDTINNSAVIMQGLGGDVSSAIFLSMRTLEGKPNSAKELLGSMKTYQYQEGDRLRIMEYVNGAGETIRPDIEIPITGYQYLIDDENNPLKPASEGSDVDEGPKDDIYRTTGWFLSVKNPKAAGFRREDVASGVDFWSQNCKVQIVRYKKTTENPVYYEMGKMYGVTGSGPSRRHEGDIHTQTITDAKIRRADAFQSSKRLAVGDRFVPLDATIFSQPFGIIQEVRPMSGGDFLYVISPKGQFAGSSFGNVYTLLCGLSDEVVVTMKSGDSYLKLRRQVVNAKDDFEPELSPGTVMTYNPTIPREAQYSSFVVEDDSVSDFFESNSYSYGRAHVENIEQSQMRRVSSITYSDPFAFDSNRLALSSFNPTLFPYKDMPSKYGEVTALVDGNESLTCLQESKVSMVPVNRNVVEMGGDSSMVTSTDVLGNAMFMAGEFGPGVTKDGVVNRFGQLYFSDVRAGRVCRVDGSGITPISEIKMESYFEGLFGGVNNCVAKPKIPSGFDPENGEYIVTTEPINFSKLVQDESTVGFCPTPEDNMVFDDIIGTPTFSKDMLLSWGTEKMEWDEVDELNPDGTWSPYLPQWQEMHQGTIYIDRITERSGIYIDPEFENPIQDNSITDVIKIDVVDQLKTVRGFFRISLKDFTVDAKTVVDPDEEDNKLVTLLRTTSGGGDPTTTLTIAPVVDPDKATVAWSPTAEKWLTFYSFIPEMYANIQNRFFSFKDGKMWQHNMGPVRNSFYEETPDEENNFPERYPSRLRLISRGNPSSVKAYKAMSTEGNRAWGVKLRNDTQRTADIEASHFHLKEGMRYANIPRVTDSDLTNAEGPDENLNDIPSTAYRIIGTVGSIDFDRITFTSDITSTPIITGPSAKVVKFTPGTDAGWQNVTGNWKIEGLVTGSRNKVYTNLGGTFTDIQPGDFIANVYTTGVDGDMFRGYYAQITLENSESKDNTYTGPIEFYAANMVYDASSLHNDGGQPNNQ